MAFKNAATERTMAESGNEPWVDPLVQFVDGFPLPLYGFIPDVFRQVLGLAVRPGDIILSTYPKSGTTWTQYIIWGLLNNGKEPPNVNQMIFNEFPFLELVGKEPFEALKKPRLAKFHLPYEMTPKCPGVKLMHVLRNPFDACVSLYSHIVEIDATIAGINYNFDSYFETFLQGKSQFGDYFEHEISWFEHRNDPDVLFLTFESLKFEPRTSLLKIADFLCCGKQAREDNDLVEAITRFSSFNYLKDNCQFRISKDAEALAKMGADYPRFCVDKEKVQDDNLFRTVNFFRKGQVGSSKERLSTDQWRRIEEAIQNRVTDPELRRLMMETGSK